MSLFILFICFLVISSSLKKDARNSDAFRIFIGIIIGLLVLSIFLKTPLGILSLIGLIVYLCNKKKKSNTDQKNEAKYGWDAKAWNEQHKSGLKVDMTEILKAKMAQEQAQMRRQQEDMTARQMRKEQKRRDAEMGYTSLPKRISKRKKILARFNDRFELYLTPEQITSIVNASYMSQIWRMELEAMNRKYEAVYEWFSGPTSWLRAYLYAFPVQEVSSDILQQERICMYAYEEIFRFADSLGSIPIPAKIERINHRFLTKFDDISYMIAYRFLEERGLHHSLENQELVHNENEIDELLEKYRTSPSETPAM